MKDDLLDNVLQSFSISSLCNMKVNKSNLFKFFKILEGIDMHTILPGG